MMNLLVPARIETERLVLRHYTRDDMDALAEMLADAEVTSIQSSGNLISKLCNPLIYKGLINVVIFVHSPRLS